MTPHNKSAMIHKYNKSEWTTHADFFLIRAFFDPSSRQQRQPPNICYIEISRANILEDSLANIVNKKLVDGRDPLKCPLQVRFQNEPGIDEGGVSKEYFSLIMKEIFNPQYGMFKFNEDTQLYWFNGQTFEPNINFELVGTLMGIAIYNNCHIDLPLAHACYKLLLD